MDQISPGDSVGACGDSKPIRPAFVKWSTRRIVVMPLTKAVRIRSKVKAPLYINHKQQRTTAFTAFYMLYGILCVAPRLIAFDVPAGASFSSPESKAHGFLMQEEFER